MDKAAIEEKIPQLAEKIAREFQPEKIILFGSYAWGAPHQYSDVDLCIIKESDRNVIELMREVHRIIFDEGVSTDVVVYTPAQADRRMKLGDPFINKIFTSGRVLYARK